MNKHINIALLGYGKMGHMIESIAGQHDVKVITHFDENNLLEDTGENRKLLENVSVLVDFTIPSAVIKNIESAAAMKKNIVIGTTGWQDRLPEVEKTIKDSNIGVLHGSNFSLGVNLFYKVSEYAAQLFFLNDK